MHKGICENSSTRLSIIMQSVQLKSVISLAFAKLQRSAVAVHLPVIIDSPFKLLGFSMVQTNGLAYSFILFRKSRSCYSERKLRLKPKEHFVHVRIFYLE